MKKALLVGLLVLVALMLLVPAATAGHGGKTPVPTNVDDGAGGGAYPHWTGACGVGSPYTTYTYGWVGYFSSTARDKCYGDGFMYRELWNGSSWNWYTRYD